MPAIPRVLKHSLLFLAILAGLFVFALTPPGQQHVVQPWTTGVAAASAGVMRLFDSSVIAQGATIASSTSTFAIAILPGSNGMEAMIVLAAAIIAFPATWAQRGAGIALGIVAIPALNFVRIVILFYLGLWNRQWFDWAYLYLWQALIMLDALFIWLLWVHAVRARDAAPFALTPTLALLGRTLLALPVAFALWYFTAPFFDDVAARIAKPAIKEASGGTITDLSYRNRQALYSLQVRAPYRMYQKSQPPAIADLEVNASVYTYGLALFLALSAALKASRRAGRIAIGCVVLALIPGWGVAFDVLKQLGGTASLAAYLEWTPGFREAIAVGYQFGALLFPTLVPVALWLGLNREIFQPVAPPPPVATSAPDAGG